MQCGEGRWVYGRSEAWMGRGMVRWGGVMCGGCSSGRLHLVQAECVQLKPIRIWVVFMAKCIQFRARASSSGRRCPVQNEGVQFRSTVS